MDMTAIGNLRQSLAGLAVTLALSVISGATAMAQIAPDFAVPAADAPAPGELPPRPNPDPEAEIDAMGLIERTTGLYAHFRAAEPPLDERVLGLEIDPARAFALIRDTVQSIPYVGHLRDTEAVLSAGSGNAVDKALALADLLGRMGYDARLVQGDASVPAPDLAACGTGTVDPEAWKLTGLGPEVLARIPLRAAATYGLLHDALSPSDTATEPALAPHVWVQVREGADWVDLDPWLPGTAYGDHPGGTGQVLDQPPEPHAVSISLQLETLREGELRQTEILQMTLQMPDAADDLVLLTFAPETGGIGGSVASALDALNGTGQKMVGVLFVNDQNTPSRAFAAPGQSQTEDGGFLSDGGAEGDVTTALFLEVTSRTPGQPDHSERRTIIDIVPPAARLDAGTAIDPAQLLPVTQGDAYPAALESLRQIIVTNGGMSRRMMAAQTADQVMNLGDVLTRASQDALTPWDLFWSSWLEARRVALASEVILNARPEHAGSCAVITRPRVMIWGMAATGTDDMLRWLDWTIDDIAVIGGTAVSQAEMRLWHGALQAALEKEALMRLALLPDDLVPLDRSVMTPLSDAQLAGLGAEPAADLARGYVTLASADLPAETWWRVDPVSGSADARGLFHGNVYGHLTPGMWGAERATIGRQTEVAAQRISQAQQAYHESRTNQQLLAEIRRDMRLAEQAARQPKCGGNEYMILGSCVSIPISIATGVGVTLGIVGVFYLIF
jgi:hypothetical protein